MIGKNPDKTMWEKNMDIMHVDTPRTPPGTPKIGSGANQTPAPHVGPEAASTRRPSGTYDLHGTVRFPPMEKWRMEIGEVKQLGEDGFFAHLVMDGVGCYGWLWLWL